MDTFINIPCKHCYTKSNQIKTSHLKSRKFSITRKNIKGHHDRKGETPDNKADPLATIGLKNRKVEQYRYQETVSKYQFTRNK
jgi:hypothetical protein